MSGMRISHTLRGCVDWNPPVFNSILHHLSHTLRGCVDWNRDLTRRTIMVSSHPAWVCGLKHIRTDLCLECGLSHPAWVCGLKRWMIIWIKRRRKSHPAWVCGLKHPFRHYFALHGLSHPAWVCGLKHKQRPDADCNLCHTLRGCVDWNQIFNPITHDSFVTPCVGVWIETWIKGD